MTTIEFTDEMFDPSWHGLTAHQELLPNREPHFAHEYLECAPPDGVQADWRCRRCVLAMKGALVNGTMNYADGVRTDQPDSGELKHYVEAAFWFAERYGWVST